MILFCVLSDLACVYRGQHCNLNSPFSLCATEANRCSYFLSVFPFSSAGICSYHERSGLCSIRLSEPLLKLRPRKDLVEVFVGSCGMYLFHVEERGL